MRAAWDGLRFLIVWAQDNNEPKHSVILDPTGGVTTRDVLLLPGSSSLDFALAAGNQEFIVFEILDGYPIVVRATRIDKAGRPVQPVDARMLTTQEWCDWLKDLDLQGEVERYEKAFGHQHVDRVDPGNARATPPRA